MAWREYGQPNASGGVDVYRTDDQGQFEYVRSETWEQNQAGGGGGGGGVGAIPGYDYTNFMGGQAIAQANAKYQAALLELQRARQESIDKPNAEAYRRALLAEEALGQAQLALGEAQRQDQVNQYAQTQGAQQQQFDVNTAMNTWQGQAQQAAQRGNATGGYAATPAAPSLPYHYQRDQYNRDYLAQYGQNPTSAQVEQQLPWYSNATQQSPTTQPPTTPAPDDKAKADSIRRQIEAKVGRAITEPEWNTLVSGKFDPQHPMVTGGQAKAGSLLTDLTNKPGDQHPMKIPGIELMEQMPESYKKLREGQPAYDFYDPQQGMINSRTGMIQVPDGQGGTRDLGPAKGYTPTGKKQDLQLFGDGNQTGGGQVSIQSQVGDPRQQPGNAYWDAVKERSTLSQPGGGTRTREPWQEGLLGGGGQVSASALGAQPGGRPVSAQGRTFNATLGPESLNRPAAQRSAAGLPTSLPGQSSGFGQFQTPYATDVNSNVGRSQQPYTPVGQPASTSRGTTAQGQQPGAYQPAPGGPGQQQGGQESLQMVYNPITRQMEYKGINLMAQQLAEELGRGNLTIAQANQRLDEQVQLGNLDIAQKDQVLRQLQNQQSYGLEQRQTTLAETMGLGNLSIAQAEQALDERVQMGQLSIADRNQALQELQNTQQFGLQEAGVTGQYGGQQTLAAQIGLGNLSLGQAAQKLQEQVQLGNLTLAQKDRALAELTGQRNWEVQQATLIGQMGGQETLGGRAQTEAERQGEWQRQFDTGQATGYLSGPGGTQQETLERQLGIAGLTGAYGGQETLGGRAQSLQEKQAEQNWQYQNAMMISNPANYALAAAMQGRAPWQQGLLGETGQQPTTMQAAGQGAQGQQPANAQQIAQQRAQFEAEMAAQGLGGGQGTPAMAIQANMGGPVPGQPSRPGSSTPGAATPQDFQAWRQRLLSGGWLSAQGQEARTPEQQQQAQMEALSASQGGGVGQPASGEPRLATQADMGGGQVGAPRQQSALGAQAERRAQFEAEMTAQGLGGGQPASGGPRTASPADMGSIVQGQPARAGGTPVDPAANSEQMRELQQLQYRYGVEAKQAQARGASQQELAQIQARYSPRMNALSGVLNQVRAASAGYGQSQPQAPQTQATQQQTTMAQAGTQNLKQQWGVPEARKMSGLQYTRMRPDEKAAFGSAVKATGQTAEDYQEEMRRWQPKAQGTAATQWG